MDWATKKIDPLITQINHSKININYKTTQSTILVINLATNCLFNLHKANLDQQKIAFNLIPGDWNTQNQPIFVVKSGHKNSNQPKAIIQLVFASYSNEFDDDDEDADAILLFSRKNASLLLTKHPQIHSNHVACCCPSFLHFISSPNSSTHFFTHFPNHLFFTNFFSSLHFFSSTHFFIWCTDPNASEVANLEAGLRLSLSGVFWIRYASLLIGSFFRFALLLLLRLLFVYITCAILHLQVSGLGHYHHWLFSVDFWWYFCWYYFLGCICFVTWSDLFVSRH